MALTLFDVSLCNHWTARRWADFWQRTTPFLSAPHPSLISSGCLESPLPPYPLFWDQVGSEQNIIWNSKYITQHHSGLPELSSSWFKLFLYQTTGQGPPSLLLPKGWKLRCLPPPLQTSSTLLVTTWGHEPTIVPSQGVLAMLQV